jgi:hypothetical protein
MISRSIVILLSVSAAAFAQKTDTSRVCWRPNALAKCNGWIVTEAAIEMPTTSTSAKHLLVGSTDGYVSDDFSARFAFTIGGMVNRGPNQAVGVTLAMLNADLPGRIEGRYRRWLKPDLGLDFTAGVMRGTVRGVHDADELQIHGLTGSFGVSGPSIGADARFDLARSSAGRNLGATYVSVRTGGRAAPIATATAFALFVGLMYLALRGETT